MKKRLFRRVLRNLQSRSIYKKLGLPLGAIEAIYRGMRQQSVKNKDFSFYDRNPTLDDFIKNFGKEKGSAVVDDLYEVTKYAKKQYGENIPYFLMGHSMGSFMARRYLMTYGEKITGAIISGTGYKTAPVLAVALFFTAVTKLFHGERYRSPFLKWLAFHTYNRKIADVKTENDWITRDAAVVAAFNENPYCKFSFTVNGYETLSDTIKYIQKQSNWEKTPKQLPILMIAGEEDPVGSYGKDVKKVYKKYQQLGCNHIELKLYQDDRHELVNELDREVVYADISQWILRWSPYKA